jgi:radical SAM protein with 4Fe4S-binding SPASM domain
MNELDFQAKNVQYLEFELSNQCQYTNDHTWCPRHILGDKPVIELKTEIIEKVVQFFKKYDFSGTVYFSLYNEPTIDSRFLDLVKYVKRELKGIVQLFTNGITITPEKAQEYLDAGIEKLRMSTYDMKHWAKFNQIVNYLRSKGYTHQYLEIPLRNFEGWQGHDDRANIYNRMSTQNKLINQPCYMAIQYYLVNCNGEVMFCWDDWKVLNSCGNLYKNSVEETLLNPMRLEYIELLKKGARDKIVPCSSCDKPTELCLEEYRDRLKLH